LASEILKVLFNLVVQNPSGGDYESQLIRILEILHDLLLLGAPDERKLDDLRRYDRNPNFPLRIDNKIIFSHSINLIMAIPAKLYDNLMPPIGNMEDKPQFEGKNMEVLMVMSDFLYRRLVISRAVSVPLANTAL
jgi:Guanine nucleotide exchange factor synembryn